MRASCRTSKHSGGSASTYLVTRSNACPNFFAEPQQDPADCSRLGIRFRWTETGIPLLLDALAHLACDVVAQYMAGDHTIFIGEVESLESFDGEPLLYLHSQYRRLQP